MLFVLFGLVSAACAGCSRGDDPELREVVAVRSSQARSAALEAGLPADVADVVALAARAPAATFSAVYVTSGVDGTVVVHQRPPRKRVDVIDGSGETVQVLVADRGPVTVSCVRRSSRWRCAPSGGAEASASAGAFSPAALEATVAALSAAAASSPSPVIAEGATIAGVPARCIVSGPVDRLCVSASGVPLLVERSDSSASVRATTYRTTVADADVRRPDD